MKIKSLLAILVFASALAACTPGTVTMQPAALQRTITVSGTGMVTLTPDIAYVSIGVHAADDSARVAINANNTKAENVINTIKSFGIEERDIQTTNFSVYPQQVYDDNYNVVGVTYAVDNTVYVTVRNLDTLGELLDAAVQAGANSIGGISFDVADRTEAVSQARLAAVENARRQADELAAATEVTIGAVQTISYYDSTPVAYDYPRSGNAPMADMVASVPVQSGTMQITTTVTIVYEIR